MAEMLDLPPELRGLVAFLEQDDRASAVLGSQDEILYQNEKFGRLEAEAKEVLSELQRAREEDGDAQVVLVRGKMWKSCRVLKEWKTLTCSGETLQTEQDTSSKPAVNDDTRAHEHGELLDWTRFDVPGLSSWVKYVRDYDWASTDLGPMASWPAQLRQCVVTIMYNPNPRLISWGAGDTFIYNEACIPLWGTKHPGCLGKPLQVAFQEVWETQIRPLFESAMSGKTTTLEQLPVMLSRGDVLEETYFDFSLIPLIGPNGRAIGVLDEVIETTKLVRGQRRRDSMVKVAEHLASVGTLKELWSSFLRGLETAGEDIPFAMFYSVVDDEGEPGSVGGSEVIEKKCILEGTLGMVAGGPNAIETFSLAEHLETGPGIIKPCLQAWKTRSIITLSSEDASLPHSLTEVIPGRTYGDKVRTAMIVPITPVVGTEVFGLLVLGLNTRCPFDDEYSLWTHLLADLLSKTASLISLPEEQRRAQKLADDINNSLSHQLAMTAIAAERSESKFKRMAQSAPTGMFVFDAQGHRLSVNDAYLGLLGQSREQHALRGPDFSSWEDSVHPDDLARFLGGWENIMSTKAPVTVEYRLRKPWTSIDKATGQTLSGDRWLLANAFPEIGADGEVTAVLGWLTDISHRKFSETMLAQRLEDALEVKRQSENFIDMTSHEMRNPLSAILQCADWIESTLMSACAPPGVQPSRADSVQLPAELVRDIVDSAQTIVLCGQHQKRIVDDILTLSKLDASLLVISPDQVRPPELVQKALKMYESEIARAGIDVSLCVEESYCDLAVDWVVLDSSRLLQIVINLLTNAIKFTQDFEQRKITICLGASRERPTGKHHNVTFIPPRHSREPSGLAEWGNGEELYLQIAVSDSGRGMSKDEMTRLFQRFSQASPKTYKQYGGSGLGLFISRELCELQGGQIGVCSEAGKTTFTFFVRTKRWVPETAEAVDAPTLWPSCASASASPIAYGRRGSVLLSSAVTNGVHPSLERKVSIGREPAVSGKDSSPSSVTRLSSVRDSKTSPREEGLHVLLVEDNLINQRVMSKQLRSAGCSAVHVANHGLECLGFLENTTYCAAETPLSVILLDLEMPTMDGLTCIRHIREQQATGKIQGHVPVIAVTANARSEQINAALSAGMDRVITKPFRIPELMPQMTSLVAEIAQRQSG